MRNWSMWLVSILFVVAAAAGGFFYARQSNTLQGTQSKILTLEDNLKIVQSDVSRMDPILRDHINSIISVVSAVQPAVLRITVSGQGVEVSGSGFIIRSDGYAVTNQHVIDAAGSIEITLWDNEKFAADVVASDKNRDLALLKLKSSRTDFPVVTLGLPADLIVGTEVVSCGFPLGLDLPGPASFVKGIISALRNLNGLNFVQTDCEIDPGSSGGCVVNLNKVVVGVTSDAVLPSGQSVEAIALAIPVTDVQDFVSKNLK